MNRSVVVLLWVCASLYVYGGVLRVEGGGEGCSIADKHLSKQNKR